ncbi:MAG: hypothetical protein IPN95_27930 [Bacteroidetes bacterium]|nr:hypothetical protein [Bacteroidota bacterium]
MVVSMGSAANATATLPVGYQPCIECRSRYDNLPLAIPLLFTAPTNYAAYLWSNGSASATVMMGNPDVCVRTVSTAQGCQDTDTVMLGTYLVDYDIICGLWTIDVLAPVTRWFWSAMLDSQVINVSTGATTQTIIVGGRYLVRWSLLCNGCKRLRYERLGQYFHHSIPVILCRSSSLAQMPTSATVAALLWMQDKVTLIISGAMAIPHGCPTSPSPAHIK